VIPSVVLKDSMSRIIPIIKIIIKVEFEGFFRDKKKRKTKVKGISIRVLSKKAKEIAIKEMSNIFTLFYKKGLICWQN